MAPISGEFTVEQAVLLQIVKQVPFLGTLIRYKLGDDPWKERWVRRGDTLAFDLSYQIKDDRR